jgi:hypothetical protein
MEQPLDELIFNSLEPAETKRLKMSVSEGRLRKIAPRVYSTDFSTPVELIVKRNLFHILNNLYPGILLSHRSAFEIKPTYTNRLFLTYKYSRKILFPGITLCILKGSAPLEDDIRIGPLCASSKHRAFLENLQLSRRIGDNSKVLPVEILQEKLRNEIIIYGENGFNQMLQQAKYLSGELNMIKEYEKLEILANRLLPV